MTWVLLLLQREAIQHAYSYSFPSSVYKWSENGGISSSCWIAMPQSAAGKHLTLNSSHSPSSETTSKPTGFCRLKASLFMFRSLSNLCAGPNSRTGHCRFVLLDPARFVSLNISLVVSRLAFSRPKYQPIGRQAAHSFLQGPVPRTSACFAPEWTDCHLSPLRPRTVDLGISML